LIDQQAMNEVGLAEHLLGVPDPLVLLRQQRDLPDQQRAQQQHDQHRQADRLQHHPVQPRDRYFFHAGAVHCQRRGLTLHRRRAAVMPRVRAIAVAHGLRHSRKSSKWVMSIAGPPPT